MNSESLRIAGQLRNAFSGDPWHGAPVRELLTGVTAEQANLRPSPSTHNIWELVLHIDVYVRIASDSMQGVPLPKLYGTERDWPSVKDKGAAAWAKSIQRLFDGAEQLAEAIAAFPDNRLGDIVPGRSYDFYYLFHGIVQHSLYHAGQIALLKRIG